MDFFKATDGKHWYISIDGGESFELCKREPFLSDKFAAPVDEIPVDEPVATPEEISLSREQLEQRGFTISKVTG
ncbi:hypothetical protein IAD21_01137 [Abditibacteriota bacterium]|nr:hypothetical protein IAD21_01137 [Abditibacteriota bacterium]